MVYEDAAEFVKKEASDKRNAHFVVATQSKSNGRTKRISSENASQKKNASLALLILY